MVFYRKYRPQNLDELIGQEAVKLTLAKTFKEQKLAHAYLLCGPRGTGKTSTARILAKMVNCETKDAPCNSCPTCKSITDGSNLDLVEIDAASNRGIDDIRALRETIKLAPTHSKKKIYIIDEVHMLTSEAFNALLKTLEEPPAHVLFILATTEEHKIPSTILSRVTKLDFLQASSDDLVQALSKVVAAEKLQVDTDALDLIANLAQGSFRDGLKLLDQLSGSGEKISKQLVQQLLQTGDEQLLFQLLDALSQKDSQQALNTVILATQKGISSKELLYQLMENLRLVVFLKQGVEETVKTSTSKEKYQQLEKLASAFSLEQALVCLDNLHHALEKIKFSPIPSLPLEIAVVESCQGQEEAKPLVHVMSPENAAAITWGEVKEEARVESPNVEKPSEKTPPNDDVVSDDLLVIKDKWNYVLETIKPYNFSLEALLKSVKIAECEGGRVVLEVPYAFHQRILETPKSRDLLESVLTDVLGKTVKVTTILGKRPARLEELANVEVAADDEIIKIASEIFSSDGI